jgi:F-type H+-transporting ATPase subunit gamma
MANTKDIRRRIKSIRNIGQLTKAMQMVAASKMRKAQQHALAGRSYATLMNKVLVSLQKRTDPKTHPLLHIRPINKELVLIISTDKGLAGEHYCRSAVSICRKANRPKARMKVSIQW